MPGHVLEWHADAMQYAPGLPMTSLTAVTFLAAAERHRLEPST